MIEVPIFDFQHCFQACLEKKKEIALSRTTMDARKLQQECRKGCQATHRVVEVEGDAGFPNRRRTESKRCGRCVAKWHRHFVLRRSVWFVPKWRSEGCGSEGWSPGRMLLRPNVT